MMRNALFGCLGGFVAVLLVLGLAGYFLVWRPAQDFLRNFDAYTAPFRQDGPAGQNGSAPRDGSGAPPAPRADVQLTAEQVRDFVRVRRVVRTAVGGDLGRFERVFADLQNGNTPNVLELMNTLRDAGGVIARAREAQQAALRRENMTPGAYENVRQEANRALGLPQVDLQAAARALGAGRLPDFRQVLPPPSAHNQRLLEPHLPALRETATLGFLGL